MELFHIFIVMTSINQTAKHLIAVSNLANESKNISNLSEFKSILFLQIVKAATNYECSNKFEHTKKTTRSCCTLQ